MDYGTVRELNYILLHKEENELSFIDFYLFQITSFGLSLFREHMLDNERISLSQAFMMRSIIEDFAVMKMYSAGDIPEDTKDLLRGYQYLCEYKIYKKYKKLNGVVFDFEEIEENYNKTKKEYYDKFGLELNSKEFRSVINGKLPFLKENYSFHSLIEMYCPEFLDIYQYLSIIIHPSEIVTNYCYYEINEFDKLLGSIFKLITDEIQKYYPDIKPTEDHKYNYEVAYCYGTVDHYSDIVYAAIPQLRCIEKIGQQIHKDLKISDEKVCLPEVFFYRTYYELESILYDKSFGFSEIIKSKIKPIFELFSVFHYVLNLGENGDRLSLMEAYTLLNYLKVKEEPFEDELKEIYPLYKKVMNIDIEYTEFERLVTKKTMPEYLGFSDINSFIFKMIDDLSTDFMWQKDMLKMLYTESQSLSHGNGYMLISNDGVFMDSNAACKAIDVLLWSILKEYKDSVFKLTNKKLQYDINKLFDEYSKIHFEKIIAENKLKSKMKRIG